jgi:hypothetical protein
MKKQTLSKFRNVVRNIFLAGLFIIAIAPAHAQDKVKSRPVEIKYLGTLDGQPVFQVEFENTNAEKLSVSLRDEYGTVLYDERFKDKKFSKKFKLETGADPVKLKFTLSNEKENQTEVFQINTNVRVVQDVVVTRL